MNDWLHILAEIGAFLAFAFTQYRQQRGLEHKLPEIITSSLRPPAAPELPIKFLCEHANIYCVITDRFVWCTKCGAIKLNGHPWRAPGDDVVGVRSLTEESDPDDTPVSRRR